MTDARTAVGSRDRRAAITGIALILGLVAMFRGVPLAVGALRNLEGGASDAQRSLRRSRDVIAEEADMRAAFAVSARRLLASAPLLLTGHSSADAASALSSLVGGIAARDRIRIGRMESLRDSTAGAFIRIAVRVEAQGDIAGISHWLATMEEGQPLLTLSGLSLSAPDARGAGDRPEVLRAEVTITGWAMLPLVQQ
jgi:hypothetical protein